MPKYLCVQRSLPHDDLPASQPPSPARLQEIYAQFGAWREQFEGNLVDLGGRLGEGRLVTDDAQPDGPYAEVKELVGGYMVLSADDLDHAATIASACPGLVRPGSGYELIEIHTP